MFEGIAAGYQLPSNDMEDRQLHSLRDMFMVSASRCRAAMSSFLIIDEWWNV